jgi:hypothetical protein
MADQYDSIDMVRTIADMLRSNPDAANAALKVADTMDVASFIAESVATSQLSSHGQAMLSSESAKQIQKETQASG